MTSSDTARVWPLMARVNAALDELHGSLGLVDSSFYCECGDIGCRERLTLTRAEYRSLREGARPVLAALHAQLGSSPGVASDGRTVGQMAPVLRLGTAGRSA